MTTEYRIEHYYTSMRTPDIIPVADCREAQRMAWADGFRPDDEGHRWWLEVHHYDEAGEPVAGGEWPCGCVEVA